MGGAYDLIVYVFFVVVTESLGSSVSPALVLDRDAGRIVPESGRVLCGEGGVCGLNDRCVGVWRHHGDGVSVRESDTRCH